MKALVVEDNIAIQLVIKKLIEKKFAFKVETASNGIEALKLMDKPPRPDVIFLDVNMPHMNGAEFLKTIRQIEENRDIPVFVMTARNDKETIAELVKYKIVDYILKPFNHQYIVEKMNELLPVIRKRKRDLEKFGELEEVKTEAQQVVVLATADADFRLYLEHTLNRYVHFLPASDIRSATEHIRNHKPDYIVVVDDLTEGKETEVAEKIRAASPQIRLILSTSKSKEQFEDAIFFDGLLSKSKVKSDFRKEFLKTVLQKTPPSDKASELLDGIIKDLTNDVLRQSFRILANKRINIVSDKTVKDISSNLYGYFTIEDKSKSFSLEIRLVTLMKYVVALYGTLRGKKISEEEAISEFISVIETLGTKISDLLNEHGIQTKPGRIGIEQKDSTLTESACKIFRAFQTDTEEKFAFAVLFEEY